MMHLSLRLSKEQFAAYPTAYTQLMVMQPFPVVSGLSMTPTQPMLTLPCSVVLTKVLFICSHWNAPSYNYPLMNSHQYDGTICVCFRSDKISVFNGCQNKISSPHDICIQHEKWRSYISPITKLPESCFGNAYHSVFLLIGPCFSWQCYCSVDVQSTCRSLSQHKSMLIFSWRVSFASQNLINSLLPYECCFFEE